MEKAALRPDERHRNADPASSRQNRSNGATADAAKKRRARRSDSATKSLAVIRRERRREEPGGRHEQADSQLRWLSSVFSRPFHPIPPDAPIGDDCSTAHATANSRCTSRPCGRPPRATFVVCVGLAAQAPSSQLFRHTCPPCGSLQVKSDEQQVCACNTAQYCTT